jgi:hypothetical protein
MARQMTPFAALASDMQRDSPLAISLRAFAPMTVGPPVSTSIAVDNVSA